MTGLTPPLETSNPSVIEARLFVFDRTEATHCVTLGFNVASETSALCSWGSSDTTIMLTGALSSLVGCADGPPSDAGGVMPLGGSALGFGAGAGAGAARRFFPR